MKGELTSVANSLAIFLGKSHFPMHLFQRKYSGKFLGKQKPLKGAGEKNNQESLRIGLLQV